MTTISPVDDAVFQIVDVLGVAITLPDQFPIVTLQEVEVPRRELMFPVGLAEGTALAHALARTETPRPLTHDLMATVIRLLGADVVAVRLIGCQASTYLAELDLTGPNGRTVIPCRPSDALPIALRQKIPAPILVDERLFENVAAGEAPLP